MEWSSQTRRRWRYWKNKLNASKGGTKQKKTNRKKDKEEFHATQWNKENNIKWKSNKKWKIASLN
eukprot:2686837-Karenia_brevis.AAC.1